MPTPIENCLNIGDKSRKWLNEIGIFSKEDLEEKGPLPTYLLLKETQEGVNLNMLWSLVGAVINISFKDIPSELKDQLLEDLEQVSNS